ncbi:hypothetical protein KC669_01630 [Candidatus Dojkabacteria bacterium]|uniref:Uncharacterized protein n=1 Tax=Candidatus Dojkabacteria bacterium TaxID=2099670 RepID=A0A955LAR2_9BACT|nr:hypothetical protein [Candidatus Dojkabacteria bacterium]
MVDTTNNDIPSFENEAQSVEIVIAQVIQYETENSGKSLLDRIADIDAALEVEDFQRIQSAVGSFISHRIASIEISFSKNKDASWDSSLKTIQHDAALALLELRDMVGQNKTYTKDGNIIQTPLVKFLSREIKDRENSARRYEVKGNKDRVNFLREESSILKKAYRQVLGKKYSGKGKEA